MPKNSAIGEEPAAAEEEKGRDGGKGTQTCQNKKICFPRSMIFWSWVFLSGGRLRFGEKLEFVF